MTQKQFEDFLQQCTLEMREKQKGLEKEYGLKAYTKYLFDQKTKTLQLRNDADKVLVFDVSCIGSWAPKDQIWIWAWANDNFLQAIREEAEQLKALSAVTGHEVFSREGFDCEEAVARDLAYMGIHQLEACGIYRIQAEDSYVFLALKNRQK